MVDRSRENKSGKVFLDFWALSVCGVAIQCISRVGRPDTTLHLSYYNTPHFGRVSKEKEWMIMVLHEHATQQTRVWLNQSTIHKFDKCRHYLPAYKPHDNCITWKKMVAPNNSLCQSTKEEWGVEPWLPFNRKTCTMFQIQSSSPCLILIELQAMLNCITWESHPLS